MPDVVRAADILSRNPGDVTARDYYSSLKCQWQETVCSFRPLFDEAVDGVACIRALGSDKMSCLALIKKL